MEGFLALSAGKRNCTSLKCFYEVYRCFPSSCNYWVLLHMANPPERAVNWASQHCWLLAETSNVLICKVHTCGYANIGGVNIYTDWPKGKIKACRIHANQDQTVTTNEQSEIRSRVNVSVWFTDVLMDGWVMKTCDLKGWKNNLLVYCLQ